MERRCQSCGMPLTTGYFGNNSDNSENLEYCRFCFQNGDFINPKLTMQEMIDSSVRHMVRRLDFTEERAKELSNAVIPKLKRWKQKE